MYAYKEKTCIICGEPLSGKQRLLCGKKECRTKRVIQLRGRRKPQQKEMWVLDMNTWTWSLKK